MSVGLLEISTHVNPEEFEIIEKGLIEHTGSHGVPAYEETPLSIVQRDDNDKIVAGLMGQSVWNWLHIEVLWVDKNVRGQGLGAELLNAAEEEARRRGCHSVYLWTLKTNGFYEKQGFKEFVVMDDYPVGHKRYGFMKRLKAE